MVKPTTEAVKSAAKHSGDTEMLDIKGEDGHRTKIALRNSIYRLAKSIEDWPDSLARLYWCLAVAMGGGQKADFYPWMVRQTIIDKLKMFYKIDANHNRPKASRDSVYAAITELQKAGLIEEAVLERYFDPGKYGRKPGANEIVVTVEDEFKIPARKYM